MEFGTAHRDIALCDDGVEERAVDVYDAVGCDGAVEDRCGREQVSAQRDGTVHDCVGRTHVDTCDCVCDVDLVIGISADHDIFVGCNGTGCQCSTGQCVVDLDVDGLEVSGEACDLRHQDIALRCDGSLVEEYGACQCHIALGDDVVMEGASVVGDDDGRDRIVEYGIVGGQVACEGDCTFDDCMGGVQGDSRDCSSDRNLVVGISGCVDSGGGIDLAGCECRLGQCVLDGDVGTLDVGRDARDVYQSEVAGCRECGIRLRRTGIEDRAGQGHVTLGGDVLPECAVEGGDVVGGNRAVEDGIGAKHATGKSYIT